MRSLPTRTIREFKYQPDLWTLVDQWADKNGFALQQKELSRRLYRRGRWLLLGPAMVEIAEDQGMITLQAWIKADLYMLMEQLNGKIPEVTIESGGLTAWVSRIKARKAVNPLLSALGQKPVL